MIFLAGESGNYSREEGSKGSTVLSSMEKMIVWKNCHPECIFIPSKPENIEYPKR